LSSRTENGPIYPENPNLKKPAKSLSLKDCHELCIKSCQIPLSSACYASSSEIGEKLKQEGQEDVISFLPIVLVLKCFGRRGPDHGYNLSRPLDPLPRTQHFMDRRTPSGKDSKQQTESIFLSIAYEFNGMNEKIEESTNGFFQMGNE
jgi:hypothetical protein